MDNQGTNKRSGKKIALLLIGLVVVVALAVGAYLFGFVYAGIKNPSDTVSVRQTICTADVVDSFNKVSTQLPASQEDITRINTEQLQKISEINAIANANADPTCVAIALRGAIIQNDPTLAEQHMVALSSFADKNVFADTRLFGIASIAQLRAQVEGIKNSVNQNGETGTGDGDTTTKD